MGSEKKSQISKNENNLTDARFDTILKVFKALNAKINFNVKLGVGCIPFSSLKHSKSSLIRVYRQLIT